MCTDNTTRTLLSFTIPCYRSEKTVRAVVEEIKAVVAQRKDLYDYEIVCINDFSPDNVWEVLRELASEDSKVKAVNMAINRGKHAALMAAFSHVSGDIVIAVDDDGETPVPELWNLIEPLSHGYDVAIAHYPSRPVSWLKEFESDMNDRINAMIYDKPRGLKFSNFVARKRFVCDYSGPYPMLEGATLAVTRKIAQVDMQARTRLSGTSGFTFRRGLSLMLNGCTTYSMRPLRLGWSVGSALMVLSLVSLVISIVGGFGLLVPLMLFGFGAVFYYLALIAEYVGRSYMAVNGLPQFVEVETINCEDHSGQGTTHE